MAADIKLDEYVQRKFNRHGKEFFYFRIVRDGKEKRQRLPHPFDDGYRSAYNAAWEKFFGVLPVEPSSGSTVADLCERHESDPSIGLLSKDSKYYRDRALSLLKNRFGEFEAFLIKPVHMQALYDNLAQKPQVANRLFDDIRRIFQRGISRGFSDINPAASIERIKLDRRYEPWPDWAIEKVVEEGRLHLVRAFLLALYTGQRQGDVLAMEFQSVRDDVWNLDQGKTGNDVPVPLHPIARDIVNAEWERQKSLGIMNPRGRILRNSRDVPLSSGFGASWRTEMKRLGLHGLSPRLTFHGLRSTNATLIATAVANDPERWGGIDRVQSLLGHHSRRMSEQYAHRAKQEHLNNDSVAILPDFGNPARNFGNPA